MKLLSFIKQNLFNNSNKKLTFIILFSTILSACSLGFNEGYRQDADTDKPVVLTTFTVIADIANNIAGDRIEVKSITKQGAEIHGYQPTPGDIVKASKANLILENGLGLELWAKEFIKTSGDVPSIVLSEGIEPILIESDAYKGRPNPHVWMSPKKAIIYVDKIVEAFSTLDPEGASIYKNNGNSYKIKLKRLDNELQQALNQIPLDRKILVTCEGALSYLAYDYGMQEAYLWPVNAESEVTPKRLMVVIQKVKENKIPAVFCESTVSPKAQMEVVKATGAKFGGVFYVDSLSLPGGPASTFIEMQKHNVRLIVDGLKPYPSPSSK